MMHTDSIGAFACELTPIADLRAQRNRDHSSSSNFRASPSGIIREFRIRLSFTSVMEHNARLQSKIAARFPDEATLASFFIADHCRAGLRSLETLLPFISLL